MADKTFSSSSGKERCIASPRSWNATRQHERESKTIRTKHRKQNQSCDVERNGNDEEYQPNARNLDDCGTVFGFHSRFLGQLCKVLRKGWRVLLSSLANV